MKRRGPSLLESRPIRGERPKRTIVTGRSAKPLLNGEYPAICCRKRTRKNASVERPAYTNSVSTFVTEKFRLAHRLRGRIGRPRLALHTPKGKTTPVPAA